MRHSLIGGRVSGIVVQFKSKARKQISRHSARHQYRSAEGMYLLETLVALTVGAFISFALLDMLCGSMRTMETSHNEAAAAEILDELSEQTRAHGYNRLYSYLGQSFPMVINETPSATYPDSELHKRPLGLDFVSKTWNSRTVSNAFGDSNEASVSYAVASGPIADSIRVKIDVTWTDPRSSLRRSVTRSVVLFKPAS